MQRVSSQRCRELYEEEKVPKIRRRYRVKNFVEGVKFFNDICEIAESENHHPDLHLEGYQHVTVCIYTHSVCKSRPTMLNVLVSICIGPRSDGKRLYTRGKD
mmetsp:Transcript_15100/g.30553  ORF Transcript_15100/g.30553 Transcript_15100/m.30553 type:complete len:102 (+) Transcript_15100:388-693(+)